jgi:hypothetical protein
MCIVAAPKGFRYVALSYVWGRSTQLQLTKANCIQLSQGQGISGAGLSATIEDTMTLVGRLGEQYLWVDALCNVSDDEDIRTEAIVLMDEIYAGSLLTVVVSACDSADESLRGVGTERYYRQVTREVSYELTLLAHFDASALYRRTVYRYRAWT